MATLLTDELWNAVKPFLPRHPASRLGGRKRVGDRQCLIGILFVLRSGVSWELLPQEMGCGSGVTCWRRFCEWTRAGVWGKAHRLLLQALGRRGQINLDRAVIDCASLRAVKGGRTPARTPRIGGKTGANVTWSRTRTGSRW
jgi:transposase